MIVLQSDQAYLNWTQMFLQSFIKSNPAIPIFYKGYDVTDDQLKALETISPQITTAVERKGTQGYPLPYQAHLQSALACRKAFVLREAMQRFDAPYYIVLDVDFLVRGSLAPLMNLVETASCVLPFLQHSPEHLRVSSAIVGVRNDATSFVDCWIDQMMDHTCSESIQQWDWFWDQVALYRATQACPDLHYANIPTDVFVNHLFSEKALIWSPVSHGKEHVYSIFQASLEHGHYSFSIKQALDFYHKGFKALAFSFCTRCLEDNPNHLDAWYLLGLLYLELNNKEQAQLCYNAMKTLDPRDPRLYTLSTLIKA